MKYSERVEMMKALDPAQLAGGKTPADKAEAYFRWHVLELMADIAENVSSYAYSQSQILKLHQEKSGRRAPGPRTAGEGE